MSLFEAGLISQGFWKAAYPDCTRDRSSDRWPDKRSYDQTNTGALIRPACSSANPGIQGATTPPTPQPPKDHLPGGDTDPVDLMSTPKRCLGAFMESEVLSQWMRHVQKASRHGEDWLETDLFVHKSLPNRIGQKKKMWVEIFLLLFLLINKRQPKFKWEGWSRAGRSCRKTCMI